MASSNHLTLLAIEAVFLVHTFAGIITASTWHKGVY